MSEQEDPYFPDLAVAELCGLSVATLRRWCLFTKGPPFRKFGSAVRYSRVAVSAWIEEHKS